MCQICATNKTISQHFHIKNYFHQLHLHIFWSIYHCLFFIYYNVSILIIFIFRKICISKKKFVNYVNKYFWYHTLFYLWIHQNLIFEMHYGVRKNLDQIEIMEIKFGFSNCVAYSLKWSIFFILMKVHVTPRAYILNVIDTWEPLLPPSEPLAWLSTHRKTFHTIKEPQKQNLLNFIKRDNL